jgi:hypothetical protein
MNRALRRVLSRVPRGRERRRLRVELADIPVDAMTPHYWRTVRYGRRETRAVRRIFEKETD